MKNRKLSIRISEADLQTIHQQAEKEVMEYEFRVRNGH